MRWLTRNDQFTAHPARIIALQPNGHLRGTRLLTLTGLGQSGWRFARQGLPCVEDGNYRERRTCLTQTTGLERSADMMEQ